MEVIGNVADTFFCFFHFGHWIYFVPHMCSLSPWFFILSGFDIFHYTDSTFLKEKVRDTTQNVCLITNLQPKYELRSRSPSTQPQCFVRRWRCRSNYYEPVYSVCFPVFIQKSETQAGFIRRLRVYAEGSKPFSSEEDELDCLARCCLAHLEANRFGWIKKY
jgi:hypothetical protein